MLSLMSILNFSSWLPVCSQAQFIQSTGFKPLNDFIQGIWKTAWSPIVLCFFRWLRNQWMGWWHVFSGCTLTVEPPGENIVLVCIWLGSDDSYSCSILYWIIPIWTGFIVWWIWEVAFNVMITFLADISCWYFFLYYWFVFNLLLLVIIFIYCRFFGVLSF